MKVEKKVISDLEKCYAIAPLTYDDKKYFIVSAEKQDRAILFDLDGNKITEWAEPGGVMTMVQIPGSNGEFLATHKFFSPNDSKEAKLVHMKPDGNGKWNPNIIVDLPFVHRFDIVSRNGEYYLIACCLKDDHEYKDDWRSPGKVFAMEFPSDLSKYGPDHQLELKPIKEGMLKNHGYYKVLENGYDTCIVSCDNGVFQFVPPEKKGADWEIRTLITDPASDAVLCDFDGNGEDELAVLAPFHGDKVKFYKKDGIEFKLVYEYEKSVDFLHSVYGGDLAGKKAFVTGHRRDDMDLMMFSYDADKKTYVMDYIDRACGSANVYHYVKDGKDMLVSTNRETDEVALYTITNE